MESLRKQFAQTSFISGGNASFVEDLYEAYLADPEAVGPKWRSYFDGLKGLEAGDIPHSRVMAGIRRAAEHAVHGMTAEDVISTKQGGVLKLITAYRSRGHLQASLDPLGMTAKGVAPDLDLPFHGLCADDLGTEFTTGVFGGPERMTLKALLAHLKATYSNTIGAEFMHIADAPQRRWIYERLERVAGQFGFSPDQQRRILDRLTATEGLERYLHTKYVGQKRFSLEGGDSLIALLDTLIECAGGAKLKEVVIGMAHRGRLNVLVNIMGKPPLKLFDEFEGKYEHPDDPAHTGDVKYHKGFSSDVQTASGQIHLALGFNPSHLEIIDPVIAGSVRARQTRRSDAERTQVMPVLIHGDAAFAGQGVVMELLQMSQARGFAVGGTVHVVINNQVGFTTSRPDDARSTLYCTDVAKMVGAPVLHVNGDDPEAVAFCTQMAFDFRQQFRKDVVIDLVCYRRHGHNEADEPAATQPLMYQNIRHRSTTRELYAQHLSSIGVIDEGKGKAMMDALRDDLDNGVVSVKLAPPAVDAHAVDWSPYLKGTLATPVDTRVTRAKLDELSQRINVVPDGLSLHPRVAKIYEDRRKMAQGALEADWGFAENLAYASLIAEGTKLRLVGQDAGRGTFFHRHAVLHDQHTGESLMPLQTLTKNPEHVTVIDSLLSEEAVMAFEYGYSTADPETLVIWEGQFGDFANGAQVVIDQFISSGEAKWRRLCGLVLLLPHGYEGQGPEHSSARLERFLQLCALDNMQVCVPSNASQIFHLLRRQMKRTTRKPLIVMSPKSLLRHKAAASSLDDLTDGSFQTVIADSTAGNAKKVRRVVACAGKVYYELVEDAHKRGIKDVAIVRVEQLYPFPRPLLIEQIKRYPAATELVWCQEEPMNQGAWYQINHHLRACLQAKQELHYAGRVRSPAPACGHYNTHATEQAKLVEDALTGTLTGSDSAD